MSSAFNITVQSGWKYFPALGISLTDFGLWASLRGLLAHTILHGLFLAVTNLRHTISILDDRCFKKPKPSKFILVEQNLKF